MSKRGLLPLEAPGPVAGPPGLVPLPGTLVTTLRPKTNCMVPVGLVSSPVDHVGPEALTLPAPLDRASHA